MLRIENYVKINDKLLVNKKISAFTLPILLSMKFKPFFSGSKIHNIKKLVLVLLKFMNKTSDTICIPLKGHFALKVSDENLKVFDVSKNTVTTLYTKRYASFLEQNIKLRKHNDFQPEILKWDKEEKTLSEKYYNGHHPCQKDKGSLVPDEVISLLGNLLNYSDISIRDFNEYIETIYNNNIALLENVKNNLEDGQFGLIDTYIKENYSCLKSTAGIDNIPLVLSHGDIKNNNLIKVNSDLIPIDWEYCDFRSSIFDTFFYILFQKESSFLSGKQLELDIDRLKAHVNNENLLLYKSNDISLMMRIFSLEYFNLRLSQYHSREFVKDVDKYFTNIVKIMNAIH